MASLVFHAEVAWSPESAENPVFSTSDFARLEVTFDEDDNNLVFVLPGFL